MIFDKLNISHDEIQCLNEDIRKFHVLDSEIGNYEATNLLFLYTGIDVYHISNYINYMSLT